MLFLLFHIGDDPYVADVGQIVEVLPLVRCKLIPHAFPGVSGVFSYHGDIVPLLDLSMMTCGQPVQTKMSTRIILVNYQPPAGKKRLVGIIAERVADTIRLSEGDFVNPGVVPADSDYLGHVSPAPNGIIQRIEMNRLLPAPVADQLFRTLSDLDR
jgi:chemotaxis-related protein WspB